MISKILSEVGKMIVDVLKAPETREFIFYLIKMLFIALGSVFSVGRMFNICKTDTSKNLVAYTTIVVWTILEYIGCCDAGTEVMMVMPFVMKVVPMILSSVVVYVIFGFRFYPRMDHFLDKYWAQDEIPPVITEVAPEVKPPKAPRVPKPKKIKT